MGVNSVPAAHVVSTAPIRNHIHPLADGPGANTICDQARTVLAVIGYPPAISPTHSVAPGIVCTQLCISRATGILPGTRVRVWPCAAVTIRRVLIQGIITPSIADTVPPAIVVGSDRIIFFV